MNKEQQMIDKAINKAIRKLSGFSLKHRNLKLDFSLKVRFDSIWIDSLLARQRPDHWDDGDFSEIINNPTSISDIPRFEQEIERAIAHLAKESKRLLTSN